MGVSERRDHLYCIDAILLSIPTWLVTSGELAVQ